jgi:hypothetical protein
MSEIDAKPPVESATSGNEETVLSEANAILQKRQKTNLSFVLVQIVDGRPPFSILHSAKLASVPNKGDLIRLPTSNSVSNFAVSFVNFDPMKDVQVTIGCVPWEDQASPGNANLQERMDNYIKSQGELFVKAETYAKAVILLGFAGIFGIWSFVRDYLSTDSANTSAILIGVSLLVYVSYTIGTVINTSIAQFRFNALPHETPSAFFAAVDALSVKQKAKSKGQARLWMIQIVLTTGFGYAGALLLLYNCVAKILSWPSFPK